MDYKTIKFPEKPLKITDEELLARLSDIEAGIDSYMKKYSVLISEYFKRQVRKDTALEAACDFVREQSRMSEDEAVSSLDNIKHVLMQKYKYKDSIRIGEDGRVLGAVRIDKNGNMI